MELKFPAATLSFMVFSVKLILAIPFFMVSINVACITGVFRTLSNI